MFFVYTYIIWDENEFIKLKRKSSPPEENGHWIIIIKTKKNVKRKEWKDIGMKPRLKTEEFIAKAKLVHGEKYDYSKCNYTRLHDKIILICSSHGKFQQRADSHLNGCGCPICIGRNKSSKDFIKKCIKKHEGKYEYLLSNYKGYNNSMTVKCKIHGNFTLRASSHLDGVGCKKCGKRVNAHTKEKFIERAKIIHKCKYNYSEVEYINCMSKVKIRCKIHGIFLQIPDAHLRQFQGCPKCIGIISKQETHFLDIMKIPNTKEARQVNILNKKVDGIDGNNIIYEFLGDYWHGNPDLFNSFDINKKCHKTYSQLYQETMEKFHYLYDAGYKIKYIWEKDWELWNKNKRKDEIPIQEFHPM